MEKEENQNSTSADQNQDIVNETEKPEEKLAEENKEEAVQEPKEETKELGETMWSGYNALTHWSTHTLEKGREKQKQHDAQRKRADMVRDVLTSEPWQVLEGVAA